MGSRTALRLGRVAGIEILVDWSLLIIFSLITLSLGAGFFPASHPDWGPLLLWGTALAAALLFFVSVLLHELSHAIVGRANGIPIPRITLFMFGGMAHMEKEPPSWRAELYMAAVGPITSLALGFIFLTLAKIVIGPLEIDPDNPRQSFAQLGPAVSLLMWLGPVNIILGLFNLVPGFPLDGGRILRAAMWGATGDLVAATRRASAVGQGFAWVLMGSGFLMMLGLRVPIFGGGFANGLWLALIGWFLNNAAVMSYRQLLVHQSLEDVPVLRLMHTRFERVTPQLSIQELVDEYVMPSGQRAFPVEERGRFVGLICLRDLPKRPRHAWRTTTVAEIMTPVEKLVTLSPEQDAAATLDLFGKHDVNQLPVVQDGRVLGLVRREDVLKWLSLHTGLSLGGRDQPVSRPLG
ncbi:site-2 protease family protein [Methylocaldum szegediense]|uniref:Zinc metalloprotease n=1 Tax=Methylocaldum szegediense TaxID=73780 RepID=A0ABN8X253_9GAMM|nr:site-2 protease family protein [Methylocaldum szegediense]CAI8827404.1 Zinc metalloprotease [Methylocaldum szegediense]